MNISWRLNSGQFSFFLCINYQKSLFLCFLFINVTKQVNKQTKQNLFDAKEKKGIKKKDTFLSLADNRFLVIIN